jgi:hypothetical protein
MGSPAPPAPEVPPVEQPLSMMPSAALPATAAVGTPAFAPEADSPEQAARASTDAKLAVASHFFSLMLELLFVASFEGTRGAGIPRRA